MGVSENTGYLIWGPYGKDSTIWGTISCFRKLPYRGPEQLIANPAFKIR